MKLALQPVRRNLRAKPAPQNLCRVVSVSVSKLFGFRSSDGKNAAPVSPFRMNTCKSVSKQSTLTTFRINTYEKRGEGVVHPPLVPPPRPSLNLSEPLYLLNFLYLLSLQSLAASLSPPTKSTPLESSKSSLFLQNTREGGVLSSSNLQLLTSVFAYRGVSRSSTASDSKCPRSIASCVPSGENRNLATCSEVKCVSWRAGELSSACSQRLSTPFSRTRYTTALGSGV